MPKLAAAGGPDSVGCNGQRDALVRDIYACARHRRRRSLLRRSVLRAVARSGRPVRSAFFKDLRAHLRSLTLSKDNTGCREQKASKLCWEWKIEDPELGTSGLTTGAEHARDFLVPFPADQLIATPSN